MQRLDSDGTVAAAVEYARSCDVPGLGVIRWNAGGIALFDRSGAQVRFIDNGCEYWTTQVAFGPDHSVWAIGWLGSTKEAGLHADYLTLRHFAQTGEPLGASLPRAAFPHPDYPHREPLILPRIGLWDLQVAGDRVQIILDRVNLWVETDLNGKEIARWSTGPNFARPGAFTADGLALAAGERKKIIVFNRSSGAWSQPILEITGRAADRCRRQLHRFSSCRTGPCAGFPNPLLPLPWQLRNRQVGRTSRYS